MAYRKRKKTFVLIIPRFEDILNSYYAGEVIKGVVLAANRLQIDVFTHFTERTDHRGWLDSSLLDRNFIDGIIFADIDNDVNVVKKAIRYGIPCMVLNNKLNEPINCVWIENRKAASDIVDYLVELGHTRIATIAGDMTTQGGVERLEGFREAIARHNLKLPKSYIMRGGFLRSPARSAAKKLLSLKDRPTAIFAASDVMAMEVVDEAKKQNFHVPKDLSVVGFDDNPLNMTCSISLSTVQQPIVEMARLGTEKLHLVTQGKIALPVKVALPTKLIKRYSSRSTHK